MGPLRAMFLVTALASVGYALGHLLNMWLGDEEIGLTTMGLLAFDSLMAGLFVVGIMRAPARSGVVS